MKKAIFTLIVLFLLVAGSGCNEEVCQPTAWLLSGTNFDAEDNSVVGRVGLRNADGYEIGAQSSWRGVPGRTNTVESKQIYGAYAIYELPIDPNGITPYTGISASLGDNNGSYYSFLAGTFIEIAKNLDSVIEYQYANLQGAQAVGESRDDEHVFTAGLRMKF